MFHLHVFLFKNLIFYTTMGLVYCNIHTFEYIAIFLSFPSRLCSLLPKFSYAYGILEKHEKNAIKKINLNVERIIVLHRLGFVMQRMGCFIGAHSMSWTHEQLRDIQQNHPKVATFVKYMKGVLKDKIAVWCTSSRNILHVGQNENVAIESYYTNLKNILNSAKECFNGRYMNWLIYQLIREVVIHYSHIIEYKTFGFVRNRNQEGIIIFVII